MQEYQDDDRRTRIHALPDGDDPTDSEEEDEDEDEDEDSEDTGEGVLGHW